MEIKDIAASVSASVSNSQTQTLTTKLGNNLKVLGSGTINAKLTETMDISPTNTSDATATSATAKSGDGGYAESTAMTQQEKSLAVSGDGAAGTIAGIPTLYLAIGGAVLALAIGLPLLLRKRK
jgi:hypothetical protein